MKKQFKLIPIMQMHIIILEVAFITLGEYKRAINCFQKAINLKSDYTEIVIFCLLYFISTKLILNISHHKQKNLDLL